MELPTSAWTDTPRSGLRARRISTILLQRRDALWDGLDAEQRVSLVESASPLGRRWLTVVPTQRALVLSDDAVSAGLWTRALPSPPDTAARCVNCTESSPLAAGHLDTCESRKAARTFAHERVEYAVARALGNVAGAGVDVEPTNRGRQSRNDVRLRLVAAAACPLPSIDIDVSIMAASCKTAPADRRHCSTRVGMTAQTPGLLERILALAELCACWRLVTSERVIAVVIGACALDLATVWLDGILDKVSANTLAVGIDLEGGAPLLQVLGASKLGPTPSP